LGERKEVLHPLVSAFYSWFFNYMDMALGQRMILPSIPRTIRKLGPCWTAPHREAQNRPLRNQQALTWWDDEGSTGPFIL